MLQSKIQCGKIVIHIHTIRTEAGEKQPVQKGLRLRASVGYRQERNKTGEIG